MRLRIHSANIVEEWVHMQFRGEDNRGRQSTLQLKLPVLWNHQGVKEFADAPLANLLRGTMLLGAPTRAVPWSATKATVDTWVEVIFLSIPHEIGRSLFMQVITMWAQLTMCPLDVRKEPQPGYELVGIAYNKKVIAPDKVIKLTEAVLESIAAAEVTMDPLPEQEVESDEGEDEVDFDEAEIIEHDLDAELLTEVSLPPEEETEDLGTLQTGEFKTYDAFAAEREIAAGKVASPVDIPLKQKEVYAAKPEWSTLSRIYGQSAGSRLNKLMSRLPIDWFREHQNMTAKICFLTPAEAYRSSLPAPLLHLTDKEIEEKFPDYKDCVHTIHLKNETCIIEDPACGLLLLGDANQRYLTR